MLKIIWNKKNVEKKYGKRRAKRIKEVLGKIKEAEEIDITPEDLSEIVHNSKKGDSFIIIGGHTLFPFYKVNNPTRDGDRIVWTDNFYGSTDDDSLLPERAVGRLPDGKDINFLLQQIENVGKTQNKSAFKGNTFGLGAAVWEDASRNIYKIISNKEFLLSPPETTDTIKIEKNTEILYFNLHGSDRTNKWYGQGDGRYPVALSLDNIPGLKNSIIFTEACYGAYIIDKELSESLALTFLKEGCRCFVGSTTIAYGPPTPPPTEADLMASLFFQEVLKGERFGIALLNAKHDFFKIMIDRQGFLDGDDKKTLLQFVLYGNPDESLQYNNHKGTKNTKKKHRDERKQSKKKKQ